jgi:hypothetical protein
MLPYLVKIPRDQHQISKTFCSLDRRLLISHRVRVIAYRTNSSKVIAPFEVYPHAFLWMILLTAYDFAYWHLVLSLGISLPCNKGRQYAILAVIRTKIAVLE